MTTASDVIRVAEGEIGYREQPKGSNLTKYGAFYGLNPAPWCAEFISWCFYQEGLPLTASTSKGFAYCPSGVAWFQALHRWYSSPQVGDLVFFQFIDRPDHVGLVTAINADGSITTCEGNTDSAGSPTGGQVMRRARRANIVGYGRPAYQEAPPVSVIREPIAAVPRLDGNGGWEFNRLGEVYAFDGAGYFGGWDAGTPGPTNRSGRDCVALVPTLTGNGYWLVSDAGEVYTYGDAQYPGNYQPQWGPGEIVGAFTNHRMSGSGGVTLVRADTDLYRLPV